MRVVVTAANSHGSASATSGQTAVVAGLPPAVSTPVNTSLPAISGTTTQGQTLSASNGSWSNSPTSYAYQWRRCDGSGNGCADISSATSSSYVLVLADAGSTIRVVVTASNSYGSASATSSQTTAVTVKATNHPPTFPLRVVVSGVVNTNSYDALGVLVGVTTSMTIDTPATDLDGDPLSYRWTASNGSIAGEGLSAMWTRVVERNPELPGPVPGLPELVAAPGTVTVTVTDGRGGTATHDLVFE